MLFGEANMFPHKEIMTQRLTCCEVVTLGEACRKGRRENEGFQEIEVEKDQKSSPFS